MIPVKKRGERQVGAAKAVPVAPRTAHAVLITYRRCRRYEIPESDRLILGRTR